MIVPVRFQSLDCWVALLAVLLFCALGGISSLLYLQAEDNQPLLTVRRHQKDPQPIYPTHRATNPTSGEQKMPAKQDRSPPSPAQNPAA
jgi:hypothetical protein